MSAWVLTAAGDCDTPEREAELADAVAAVLARPEFGTSASQFGGEAVNGPVHEVHDTAAEEDTEEG